MIKFCIDLEDMMLPDAIAAVVEAWYEAQEIKSDQEIISKTESDTEFYSMLNDSNQKIRQVQTETGVELSIYIERRGGKLSIRGKLPSKTEAGAWHTQRISIGLSAQMSNIKPAEILACLAISQLKDNWFRWDEWCDKDWVLSMLESIQKINAQNEPKAQKANNSKCRQKVLDHVSRLINAKLLTVGDKMPSTRDLADKIEFHRNSVTKVYEDLEREGALSAKPGAGVYITDISKLTMANAI